MSFVFVQTFNISISSPDSHFSCENPFLNKYFETSLYSPTTTETSKILTVRSYPSILIWRLCEPLVRNVINQREEWHNIGTIASVLVSEIEVNSWREVEQVKSVNSNATSRTKIKLLSRNRNNVWMKYIFIFFFFVICETIGNYNRIIFKIINMYKKKKDEFKMKNKMASFWSDSIQF